MKTPQFSKEVPNSRWRSHLRLSRRLFPWLFLLVGLALVAPEAHAISIANLFNHGGGSKGSNYGIRVDNGSVNTFSFEDLFGASNVSMTIFTSGPNANSAEISGTVEHNQSGQVWDLQTELNMHLLTTDGTEWRTDVSGDLYDQVLFDLANFGDNIFGDGEGNLKQKSFAADRWQRHRTQAIAYVYQSCGPRLFAGLFQSRW